MYNSDLEFDQESAPPAAFNQNHLTLRQKPRDYDGSGPQTAADKVYRLQYSLSHHGHTPNLLQTRPV